MKDSLRINITILTAIVAEWNWIPMRQQKAIPDAIDNKINSRLKRPIIN